VTVGKQGAVGSTVGFTVAYLTAAALLLLIYRAAWVARARWIAEPMALLGRYSYGIYIWHIFAAAVALDLLPVWDSESTSAGAQAMKYGAAIAVGVLATVAVEKPMLRLRDRLVPTEDRAVQNPAVRHDEAKRHATEAPRPLAVRQERPVRAAA